MSEVIVLDVPQIRHTPETLRQTIRHGALLWDDVVAEVAHTHGLVEADAKWIVKTWFMYWIDQCSQKGWWKNGARRRQIRQIIRDQSVASA